MAPNYSTMHRRTFSEAENLNNITETVIHEHPQSSKCHGSISTLPPATSGFYHGKRKFLLSGNTDAADNVPSVLRSLDNDHIIYAKPRLHIN